MYSDATIVRGQVREVTRILDPDCNVTVTIPERIVDDHQWITVAYDANVAGAQWRTVKAAMHFDKFRQRDAKEFVQRMGRKVIDPITGAVEVIRL